MALNAVPGPALGQARMERLAIWLMAFVDGCSGHRIRLGSAKSPQITDTASFFALVGEEGLEPSKS
jgi:hypothetical protein